MKRVLLALLLVSTSVDADVADHAAACKTRLRDLERAVRVYQLVQGRPPAKLSDLYLDGLVKGLGGFACPASGTVPLLASEIDAKSDYELVLPAGANGSLVREKTPRHAERAPPASAAAKRGPPPGPVPAPPAAPAPATAPSASDPEALLRQGVELTRAGRLAEALQLFRSAWKSERDSPALGMNRAGLELAVGDRPEGLRIADTLLQQRPDYAFALSLRGIAAFYNGDQVGAQRFLARARQLDPQVPGHHFQQARAYHQGRVAELALQHYLIAALADPQQFHAAYYSMGQIYESMNRADLAVPAYRNFLHYDRTSEWAAQAQAAVRRLGGQPSAPGRGAITN